MSDRTSPFFTAIFQSERVTPIARSHETGPAGSK